MPRLTVSEPVNAVQVRPEAFEPVPVPESTIRQSGSPRLTGRELVNDRGIDVRVRVGIEATEPFVPGESGRANTARCSVTGHLSVDASCEIASAQLEHIERPRQDTERQASFAGDISTEGVVVHAELDATRRTELQSLVVIPPFSARSVQAASSPTGFSWLMGMTAIYTWRRPRAGAFET